jgi:two-component system response regulator HupR/HoxA
VPTESPDLKTFPVLFVDDEPDIVETFRLDYDEDFSVLVATSGSQALDILAREPVAVLVADQRMPEMSGLEVIRRALEQRPDVVPIILTGYTDPDALVEAINLGRVYRYIAKPWDSQELRLAISRAIEAFHLTAENARLAAENARLLAEVQRANERLAQENRYLKACDSDVNGFGAIVGRGAAMQDVVALSRRVLDSPTTVLLQGPTGTGKELVARAIHYESTRRDRLFVAQNCGALTETLLASELFGHRKGAFTGAVADKKGLFELADGGTLFLDEISETSAALQVHLLRALQEREIQPIGAPRPVKVDVRVIAATNRDLAAEVRQGRFREDLYFRLSVFRIDLPPLARRLEDIPALAEHFLRKSSVALNRTFAGISTDAMTALMAHDYRGNVRELQNLIERATLLAEPGERITEAHLFDGRAETTTADAGKPTLEDDLSRFEQQRIAGAIAQCGGNKSEAARQLGLTYRGLLKKMQRFGMTPTGERKG